MVNWIFMLGTIKAYIEDLPEDTFEDFYQKYIFAVQDQNILQEVSGVKTTEIIELNKLISILHKGFI